jgi:hypothetical protein
MYHFPETRMHKNARPRVSGHTVPVMKEMKEKWGARAAARNRGRRKSVSYQLLENERKSIICFIRTVAV